MNALLTAKAGTCLAVASILAVVVMWADQSVQAHTQSLPSCSSRPTADDFFTDGQGNAVATAAITVVADGSSATIPSSLATKAGTGQSKEGNKRYRYAKITVPQLAAGELRVFSTGENDPPADAILCYGSEQRAYYKTTYDSDHDREESAARTARTSAKSADDAAAKGQAVKDKSNPSATPSELSTAEDNARSALRTAASALDTASRALETAGEGEREDPLTSTSATSNEALEAQIAAKAARDAATASVTVEDNDPASEISALGTAADALEKAASQLEGRHSDIAAGEGVDEDHANFMLRAKVNPGEGEYILVTVQSDPTTAELNVLPTTDPPLTLSMGFHGALSADTRKGSINKGGDIQTRIIRVTAPGLLTLGTTGSTDTKGNLSTVHTANVYVDGGGNSGNFSMAVPVLSGDDTPHTLTVAGQDGKTTGSFTLTMDFAVAMSTYAVSYNAGNTPPTTATPTAVTWTPGIAADDTTMQIARRPEDGKKADEDLFVITPASSGLLTVTGNDGTGTKQSNTDGAFFGPFGEIDTDTNSGPGGTHFGFVVPVTATTDYLVRIKGTDGEYALNFDLDVVVSGHINTTVQPTSIFSSQTITATPATQQKKNRNRYLFNITDAGTLYLQTTGDDDVRGTLYGPDGKVVARNDNGGKDRNFRIVKSVTPGLYLLEVEGASRSAVTYDLTANFAIGATVDEPDDDNGDDDGDGGDDGGGSQPSGADPTGSLEEPAHGSFRSGIGVLRGWVCNAGGRGVEIRLTNTSTNAVTRIIAPNGSNRSDVDTSRLCTGRVSAATIGFAVQFNYNLLPEGEYEAEAWIGSGRDEDQVGRTDAGQTNTFEVVHISDDEFLTDEELGLEPDEAIECEVPNFPPDTRQRVILGWDEASQNFQIVDVE